MKSYLLLLATIILETIGTSSIKASEQFTKPIPSIIVIISFAGCFYLLSFVLKEIPIGITYAIWSAAGIVLISLVGYFVYKQSLDLPAILGIALIVIGVVIINLFSKASVH